MLFSLSLFLSTDDGPEKGFPPDSWKMGKAIFKLEGEKCELSRGFVLKKKKEEERFSANIKMQLKFCAEVVIFEAFLLMVHSFWMEVNAIW